MRTKEGYILHKRISDAIEMLALAVAFGGCAHDIARYKEFIASEIRSVQEAGEPMFYMEVVIR